MLRRLVTQTFAGVEVGIQGRGGDLEGQTVGPLKGVTVSDEEGPGLLVLQHCYSCRTSRRSRMYIESFKAVLGIQRPTLPSLMDCCCYAKEGK